jgi:hypothetical protein
MTGKRIAAVLTLLLLAVLAVTFEKLVPRSVASRPLAYAKESMGFGASLPPTTRELLLDDQSQMTVYAIHDFAQENMIPEELKGRPRLLGYPILASREVTDQAERRRITDSVRSAIGHDFDLACIFVPHHALTIRASGKSVTFLLCFRCGEAILQDSSGGFANRRLDSTPQPVLDAALRRP